jgi:hypothetical protein
VHTPFKNDDSEMTKGLSDCQMNEQSIKFQLCLQISNIADSKHFDGIY